MDRANASSHRDPSTPRRKTVLVSSRAGAMQQCYSVGMIQSVNDSGRALTARFVTLSVANIAAALASGAFGAVALADPSVLVGTSVTSDAATGFYVEMYALRSLVIAAGLISASVTMRRAPLVALIVLMGGGLVQLGDVAIAARFGTPGVVGACVAAVVHFATAALLVRSVRSGRDNTRTDSR